MPENFEEKILQTIKAHHLAPKPRWQFLLKDSLVWLAATIALLVGSLAVAVVIHLVQNNDWEVYRNIHETLLGFILLTLPYFWLVSLALFVGLGYYNLKHTRRGYRYRFRTLIFGNVAMSLLLGILFYNIGAGQAIDEVLAGSVPVYRQVLNPRRMMWSQPQRGVLAGVVLIIEDEETFILADFTGKEWLIRARGAVVSPTLIIAPRTAVRMIGERVDAAVFTAKIIMPWIRHHHEPMFILMPRPDVRKEFQLRSIK
ncbi:MAG: hypothetical protein A3J59_04780 [Candidatus Buchananbacteria bacterium RIFCSPHIGHO2_02_FULL_56_16]|uniref:Uncharacterized protein n=1 Tax=Candidatus Buchananbacteria bacterium RIFCSPHIGHO2_02_FULL_56_16 TaxID=1797542 RepID=A0A1G1YCN3_9BACT|nr:MAG: hypothetical protein A3J59_04780 [Candidatus Buchananbacteria bacterium RIFCSPHIGHO2_02_FULL_56_16]